MIDGNIITTTVSIINRASLNSELNNPRERPPRADLTGFKAATAVERVVVATGKHREQGEPARVIGSTMESSAVGPVCNRLQERRGLNHETLIGWKHLEPLSRASMAPVEVKKK